MLSLENIRIGVVGLGYVGLPLAVEFGKQFEVVGLDIDEERIQELCRGQDRTLEVESAELAAAKSLRYTSQLQDLASCNVFVITVPTPVDAARRPDFDPLLKSSAAIGSILKHGDVVVYESTVYPGVTEEVCVPVLEQASGLKFNVDFWCGYSPERINPGDKTRGLTNITKVTSGSTSEVGAFVDALYRRIVKAGTHLASSIRVAEAAKVIENTQRDVNIALMNELAMIFNRMGISTQEVLEAARTKWNFLPFQPGLVGGHCIGVDPYYLAHKAAMLGFHPELLLSARRINDAMGPYIAAQVMKQMARAGVHLVGSRVLVLGLTFKENCPDLRNTRVVDLVGEFLDVNAKVDVHDPWADPDQALEEYGIRLCEAPEVGAYDAVVLAVAHEQFLESPEVRPEAYVRQGGVVFDVKGRLATGPNVFQL